MPHLSVDNSLAKSDEQWCDGVCELRFPWLHIFGSTMLSHARAPRTTVRALLAVVIATFGLGASAGTALAVGVDMQMKTKLQTPADPVPVGTLMTIDFTAENSGTVGAENPTMTIQLPAAVDATFSSVISPDGTCGAPVSGLITCTFPSPLKGTQAGGGAPVAVAVKFTPLKPGVITTIATVSSTSQDSNPGNETLDVTTTVVESADLTIANTDTPAPATPRLSAASPVIAGGPITYSTIVHNKGPYQAVDAKVEFTVPTGLDYVSASGTNWNCSLAAAKLACTYSNPIAPGADAATLQWQGTVTTKLGTLAMAASVSSTTPDSVGSNNVETIKTPISDGADLVMTKTINTNPAIGSKPSIFTLTVTNNGPFDASTAVVTDSIDPVFDVASATSADWTCNVSTKTALGTPISCARTTVAVGSTSLIAITATPDNTKIPVGINHLSNTAHVGSAVADGNPGNNDPKVNFDLVLDGADLAIGISRDPHPFTINAPVVSTITVHNNGPETATGPIPVTYTLAPGEAYDSFIGLDWSCSATATVVTCSNTGDVLYTHYAPPLQITTHATLAADPLKPATTAPTICTGNTHPSVYATDTNPGNDCTSQGYLASASFADLDLTKTVDAQSFPITSPTITYTLTIHNKAGGVTATNVVLTDIIPMYVDALNGRPPTTVVATPEDTTAICSTGSTVTCSIPSLAADTSTKVEIKVTRPILNGSSWINHASVYSQDVGDPTHGDNEADAPTVSVDPLAEIELVSKTVTPASVREGVDAIYTLTARNNGPSSAANVQIDDTFNATEASGTFTFISVGGTAHSGSATCSFDQATHKAHCAVGALASGEQQTMTVRIRPDFLPGFRVNGGEKRNLTNDAVVTTDTPESDGPNATDTNNKKSATLEIVPGDVDLIIHKADLVDPLAFDGGVPAIIVYKVDVTNGGPSYGTGVAFHDKVTGPAGHTLTFLCDRDAANQTVTTTGVTTVACDNAGTNLCAAAGDGLDCTIGKLAAGDKLTRYLAFQVNESPAPTGTTFNNAVSVSGNEHERLAGNNAANENTTVRILADLAVTEKSPSILAVKIGQTFNWTIKFRNNGPGAAVDVKLTDTLPGGMEFPSGAVASFAGTGTSGSCAIAGATLTCAPDADMPNGSSVVVTAPAKVTYLANTGVMDNTASVSTKSIDLNSANDSLKGSVSVRVSSIAGHVYHDKNNNATYGDDGANSGISGVKVTLTGNDIYGPVNVSTTTGTDGSYLFTSLAPSDADGYIVTEDQSTVDAATYLDGKDTLGSLSGANAAKNAFTAIKLLSTNEHATGYDFGEVKPASIAGVVWHDQNNNKTIDSGEPGRLDGVKITLTGGGTDESGAAFTVNASAVTANGGAYSFTGLRPGLYTVTEEQPDNALAAYAGYLPGQAAIGKIAGVTGAGPGTDSNSAVDGAFGNVITGIALTGGDDATGYNFGEVHTATLAGRVYHDRNRNGTFDASSGAPATDDALIDTAELTLSGTNYRGVAITPVKKSTSSGAFKFMDLEPSGAGGYTVTETTPPDGYHNGGVSKGTAKGTVDLAGRAVNTIALGSAVNATKYDFGHVKAGISGYVYYDKNHDGARDPAVAAGETAIAEIKVTLSGAGCPAVPGTTTNSAGFYNFDDLPDCAAGWTLTEDKTSTPLADYLPGKAKAGTGASATGSVAGIAGNDASNLDTTFGNVISGIILAGGEAGKDYDFGEVKAAALAGSVYYDVDRSKGKNGTEPGIGAIGLHLDGTDDLGQQVNLTTLSAAVADAPKAISVGDYAFTRLRPGTYTVSESTQPTDYFDGTNSKGAPAGTPDMHAIKDITLEPSIAGTGYDFGHTRASIAGTVYHDKDNSGSFNKAKETGIDAITVSLTGKDPAGVDIIIPAQIIATGGAYLFDELPPTNAGGWTLTETQPAGYLQGSASIGLIAGKPGTGSANNPNPPAALAANFGNIISGVTFKGGDTATGYDFGELLTASLAGTVFYDTNNSGSFDPGSGDSGIGGTASGVKVTLTGTDYLGQAVSADLPVGIDGRYSATGLNPANTDGYVLEETTQPKGYFDGLLHVGTSGGATGTNTVAGSHAIKAIALASGDMATAYDFGHLKAGLTGHVYYDSNNNGVRDSEDPINGVTVTLSGKDCGNPPDSVLITLTAQTVAGAYGFHDLPPCSNGWTLTEDQTTLPTGYLPGMAATGKLMMPPATASKAGPGNAGNAADQPTFGNIISGITLGPADMASDYDFGEVKPGSITGTVYYDINQNTARNGSEPGIGKTILNLTGTDYRGRDITSVLDPGKVTTTTVTDDTDAKRGTYLFDGLPPGTYAVTETQPAGYVHGTDKAGSLGGTTLVAVPKTISGIALLPENTGTGYDFSEIAAGLSGTVFNDPGNDGVVDPGDTGIGGVTLTLSGCGLVKPVVTMTLADGTYFFGPLATCVTGGYTITETQPQAYADGVTKAGHIGESVVGADSTPNVISAISITGATPGVAYNFGEHANSDTDIACAAAAAGTHNVQEPFTLSYTVTNNGPSAAPLGTFTEALPAGFVLTGAPTFAATAAPTTALGTCSGAKDGTSVACDLGYVTTAASLIVSVPVKAMSYPAGGTADLSGTAGTFGTDKVPANNTCVAKPAIKQSTLTGAVFKDDSNDGVFDKIEKPIPETRLTLTGTDSYGNAVSQPVMTLTDGTFAFTGLPPAGKDGYTLTETQPSGYAQGKNTVGSANGALTGDVVSAIHLGSDTAGAPLDGGINATGYTFGEIGQGLAGKVYVDTNNNGVLDTNEIGIAGVMLTAAGTDATGAPVNQTAMTAADGSYLFGGLPAPGPSGYTLTEVQPKLWADGKDVAGTAGGTAGNDIVTGIKLPAGVVSTGYNFAEHGGQLCGFVYTDGNGNGLKDTSEVGIPAVLLTLSGNDADGQPVARTATTAGLSSTASVPGRYCLNDLPVSDPSGYTITETQPTGVADGKVTPGTLGGTAATNVIGGIAIAAPAAKGDAYNFGEGTDPNTATLSGFVYLDNTHDGIHHPGEGQGGWIVQLVRGTLGGTSDVIATTTSNPDGSYTFTGLPPGDGYSVLFRSPENNVVYGFLKNLLLPKGDKLLEQNQPLDPSGIIFDSVTRLPLAGAVVSFTGPPGFNPVTDLVGGLANLSQTTGVSGSYKFLLFPGAPVGVYTISVTVPGGYVPQSSGALQPCVATLVVGPAPSPALVQTSNSPPALGAPVANPNTCAATSAGLAAGGGTTQYYVHIYLDQTSADLLNNHIAVDPVPAATALVLSKTTPKTEVVIGELVPYTITVKNPKSFRQTNISIVDQLPPGFKYRLGSAHLDGATLEPVISGRQLSWPGISLEAKQTATVKLLMSVGSGVGESEFVNQAWTVNMLTKSVTSNVAGATVRVTPDPTFDCTDVIGKVFEDRNRNGYVDAGEPGLANVRLATVNGLLITTDGNGRFHIACADIPDSDRGSNFILKVDVRTLPTGYRLTTENPGLVHITRGKLAKLNFGASISKVVRVDMLAQAFVASSLDLSPQWDAGLPQVLDQLTDPNAVLRLAYGVSPSEDQDLAQQRLRSIADRLRGLWRLGGGAGNLTVETELYHVAGLK